MTRALLYPLLPAALLVPAGLWLWSREGAAIWLSGFISGCF